MTKTMYAVVAAVAITSASLAAQWPKIPDPTVPRKADGTINYDAPTPRTADGKPDLSGIWMPAQSGPPRGNRGGGRAGEAGRAGRGREGRDAAPPAVQNGGGPQPGGGAPGGGAAGEGQGGAFAPVRGGVSLEPTTTRFPYDPKGPPVATFFEAGGNMEGGLPYTPWAKDLKKARMDLKDKDNPDANCMPMGFLQFHQQPQPRKIIETSRTRRSCSSSGRPTTASGTFTWTAGSSRRRASRSRGGTATRSATGTATRSSSRRTTCVVLKTARTTAGSTSTAARTASRRSSPSASAGPTFGHLQIDITIEDPKAYTKPFTVRIDQRIAAGSGD